MTSVTMSMKQRGMQTMETLPMLLAPATMRTRMMRTATPRTSTSCVLRPPTFSRLVFSDIVNTS